MNLGRETILAGVVGFALGLLAAWAVWSIPQILPKRETPPPVSEEAIAPEETFGLSLTQPEDEAIFDTASATVSGKTEAKAMVIINGPLGEEVVETTSEGTFSTTVTLEEGANEIVVTAYPPTGEGEEQTETRTVFFTKEEF